MRSLLPWPIFPSNLDPPAARSLSIQFILQGVLDAFKIVQRLQTITPQLLQGANLKEEVGQIAKELQKLLLFSLSHPFAQKSSVVDKLCFYCDILLQTSHGYSNEIVMTLEDMRTSILKTKAEMDSWQKMLEPLDQVLSLLLTLYTDLFCKLSDFMQALRPFLKNARGDENILIYLLENKDQFNTYLGSRYVEKMLQDFFPAGHEQFRAAISEGYTRRGFTAFLSKAEPLINAIEWESSCHPTLTP